jgi:hypothetical protein
MVSSPTFARTIQLFLVDGSPTGLRIASIHGWTGSVIVSTQSTFDRLLQRAEVDRTGIYILQGPDSDNLRSRVYIGEADSVRNRISESVMKRDFWETAVVVTTSDGTGARSVLGSPPHRHGKNRGDVRHWTTPNFQMPIGDGCRRPIERTWKRFLLTLE